MNFKKYNHLISSCNNRIETKRKQWRSDIISSSEYHKETHRYMILRNYIFKRAVRELKQ